MLVHHLLSGLIIGTLAAVASLLHGFSTEGAVGFYILGANIGLLVSALGALSSRIPHPTRRLASPLR